MATVFRLEKEDHCGPFSGNQDIVLSLIPHRDPEDMIREMGISKRKFKQISKLGWLFAWKDEELSVKFIKPDHVSFVIASGFNWHSYEVHDYLTFPDGQIMFDPTTARNRRLVNLYR